MNVGQLIRALQKLPPETIVVKFADPDGVHQVDFIERAEVVRRRPRNLKMRPYPSEFISADCAGDGSRAQKFPVVYLF